MPSTATFNAFWPKDVVSLINPVGNKLYAACEFWQYHAFLDSDGTNHVYRNFIPARRNHKWLGSYDPVVSNGALQLSGSQNIKLDVTNPITELNYWDATGTVNEFSTHIAWIRVSSITDYQPFFSFQRVTSGQVGGQCHAFFGYATNGEFMIEMDDENSGSVPWTNLTTTPLIPLNTWTMVTVQLDKSKALVRLNNVYTAAFQVNTSNSSYLMTIDGVPQWGGRGGYFGGGHTMEVAMCYSYGRAITTPEHLAIYNATVGHLPS